MCVSSRRDLPSAKLAEKGSLTQLRPTCISTTGMMYCILQREIFHISHLKYSQNSCVSAVNTGKRTFIIFRVNYDSKMLKLIPKWVKLIKCIFFPSRKQFHLALWHHWRLDTMTYKLVGSPSLKYLWLRKNCSLHIDSKCSICFKKFSFSATSKGNQFQVVSESDGDKTHFQTEGKAFFFIGLPYSAHENVRSKEKWATQAVQSHSQ